jgi:PAS domain S-box-containing protein
MIERVFITGEPASYESVAAGPNGTLSTYVTNLGPIITDGTINEISFIGSDITKQRLTEAKLENTIEMLHFSQEAANIGTWWLTLPDKILHWTPQVFRIFGLDNNAKTPTIKGFLKFIHPEDAEFVRKKGEEQLVKTDIVSKYTYRIIRPNGQVRILEHIGRQIRDTNDEIIQLIGTIQDITDQKKTEESLIESEEKYRVAAEKYRAAFQDSRDAISILSPDHTIIDANKQMLQLSGYSLKELKTKDITDLYPSESAEELKKRLSKLMHGELPPIFEIEMKTKSGDLIPVEVGVALMKNCYDQDIVFQSTIRDVSQRKKTENALQNIQRLESLGVLAGGIAHDFNNLLGGIYGYIDLAHEYSTDNKVSDYISRALKTIDRARALTQQLLTFSKGGEPVIKTASLFPFIRETVQFVLSGSNVSCIYSFDDDLWPCRFDWNQIGQVIDNIIINALQAMPRGGEIRITAHNYKNNEIAHPHRVSKNYVRISIEDSGTGIPAEILERIFDPFFSTKEMGQGLGLAVCYSIIKRHNGWIEVKSEPGIGTKFTFYLPAAAGETSSSIYDIHYNHKGTGTILIMDDEITIRDSLRLILSSFGYTIVCTKNGKETVDTITEAVTAGRTLTGMILDLTITGGMGGKEVIDVIPTIDKNLPVIVMSGYAEDPIMAAPEKYGFNASLRKPFTRAELIQLLQRYFS